MIYHLELEARFCKVEGFLNKFPIYNLNGTNPAIFSKPINGALIGKDNVLNFIITESKSVEIEEPYSIKGSIKKYLSNQMTGPDQGEIVTTFSFENQPIASLIFDNEIFNYSYLFREGQQFENEGYILDYAEKLQALLTQRNISALLSEFDFKLQDFAIAYSVVKEVFVHQFIDYMENCYYANNPILDFTRQELFLRPWCDKRIWEIGVSSSYKALMLTEPNAENNIFVTKVYVALINNTLKVIR